MFTYLPKDWPRLPTFQKYRSAPCLCSLTAEIDVTPLFALPYSFTGLMTWAAACVVNNREEFRLTVQKGRPALWDVVHPVHNLFHPDTETCTSLFTLWDPDPAVFLARFQEDRDRGKALRIPEVPAPPNVFETSALPWLHYTALSVSMLPDHMPLTPLITWGQAVPASNLRHNLGFVGEWSHEGGERGKGSEEAHILPLTMQIHHAAADGFHIARFFRECQAVVNGLPRRLG